MNIIQKIKNQLLLTVVVSILNLVCLADTSGGRFNGWQVIGPTGGDIRSIAIDPRDKNRLYITTLDSQVYTSADAGKSWNFLTAFPRQQIILDNVLVDLEDSKTIYVSGQRNKSDGGLIYSNDGGQTWTESKDLQNQAIHALAQSSIDPNVMLAGADGKVFMSYNRGQNWQVVTDDKVGFRTNFVDSAAFDPKNPNIVYVGTSHRAYKSTDGGKNWRLIVKGMIDDSDVFAIHIDPQNPDNIIASACSGIYRSENAGELWSKIQGIPSESRRTRAIVVNPARNGEIYAGTSNGFWMSSDNGRTWSLNSQRELEINAIAVHPEDPKRIYIGTNHYGMMISTDGGRTVSIQNGNFSSRFMQKIVADLERPNRYYALTNNTSTGGGFIFISDNGGQSWQPSTKNLSILRNHPLTILQDRQNPNTIYLGTNIGVYRSIDRGASWSPVGVTPTKPAASARKTTKAKTIARSTSPKFIALKMPVRQLAFTNDGKNGLLAATDLGLYRTYNLAQGWEKISLGAGIVEQIYSVHTPQNQPSTIFVGTIRSGLLVSRDNGLSWQVNLNIPNMAPVKVIETDPVNPARVYVGTSQSMFVSRDGGETFIRRGGMLPSGDFNAILINPANTNEVFVASSMENKGGVYHSQDAGQSWRQLDTKDLVLPTRRVWTMVFDSKNPNRILLGSHSSGIYAVERMADATGAGTRPRVATN